MQTINIGGYSWKVPAQYGELTREQIKALSVGLTPRETVKAMMPKLPASVLPDDVILVIYTIAQWVHDEVEVSGTYPTPPDDWTWHELEQVRELIAGHPYPHLKAADVAELLNITDDNWFNLAVSAIFSTFEFLSRFHLVFEGSFTDEEREAGAEALLQFKYYGAANRLAEAWHMTPQKVLQEKAGDVYLKLLYDITKDAVNDKLQENNK